MNFPMTFRTVIKLNLLLWLLLPAFVLAQFPEPQQPPRLVNDFADVMSAPQRAELENMLVAYDDSTSTQIAIVTVKTLDGYDVADYANRLYEQWGIGGKDNNNGVLILLGLEERKVRIETGYGVEDRLTDALSRRIIEQQLLPAFREGDYAGGFQKASLTIFDILSGAYVNEEGDGEGIPGSLIGIVLLFILFIIIANARNGGGGQSFTGRGRNIHQPFFFPMGGGSSWGGGGGGGGSFGGFGGGMSGGGGASGGW